MISKNLYNFEPTEYIISELTIKDRKQKLKKIITAAKQLFFFY